MPGYKVHLAGGAVFGAAALAAAITLTTWRPEPLPAGGMLATCVLAALFPDVDTSSKGRPLFYGLLAAVDVYLIATGLFKWAALLGLVAMLPALGNHRGWTHTWWGMLLLPLAVMAVPLLFFEFTLQQVAPFYGAAVLGYFSHLFLDTLR